MSIGKLSKNTYTVKLNYGEVTGPLRFIQYVDGSPGLMILTDEGPEVLSINLAQYGLVPGEGYVYVKDYSEHEGLPNALVRAGVATKVAIVEVGPFKSRVWLMKVVAE